jgi:hypothetical protein
MDAMFDASHDRSCSTAITVASDDYHYSTPLDATGWTCVGLYTLLLFVSGFFLFRRWRGFGGLLSQATFFYIFIVLFLTARLTDLLLRFIPGISPPPLTW